MCCYAKQSFDLNEIILSGICGIIFFVRNMRYESIEMLSFVGALSTTWIEHEQKSGEERDIIHLKVLNRFVQPGDIVMFKCRDTVATIQRSVTGAEWDHIGMIVKRPNVTMCSVLEATADGVTVLPLIQRIRAYSSCFTQYIVLRKLHIEDSAKKFECRKKLFEFVEQVDGKPYGMGIGKFINQKGDTPDDFFCSELIAAALKAMGLVDLNAPSSSFWPGCFASGGNIDIELRKHGASLKKEVLIDCRMLEIGRAKT